MIPQAYIAAWRKFAPWPDDAQIEQDLILSRALVALFSTAALQSQLALRGGTALNKLYLASPARYSEDIDLVQVEADAIGPIINEIRKLLDPWLGPPKRSAAQKSTTLQYRFESEIPPTRTLRLKLEINTLEHFAVLGFQSRSFAVENPWFQGSAAVQTYHISELLGTKLRALYQRRKGRDLFDLWFCSMHGLLQAADVVRCFTQYMRSEEHDVSRAEFERNLYEKSLDRTFLTDIKPLLAAGVEYDASTALQAVRKSLIEALPGAAWAGMPEE